jgi:hypothetical protein
MYIRRPQFRVRNPDRARSDPDLFVRSGSVVVRSAVFQPLSQNRSEIIKKNPQDLRSLILHLGISLYGNVWNEDRNQSSLNGKKGSQTL